MKNLKTLAAALALGASAFAMAPAHAGITFNGFTVNGMKMNGIDISGGIEAGQVVAVTLPVAGSAQPENIRTCTKSSADCADPNGPILDGIAQPQGVKTCRTGSECTDPNGPSLDGVATAPSLRQGGMTDMNGPSLDGFVDSDPRRPGSRRFHDRHSRRSCRYDLQRHND